MSDQRRFLWWSGRLNSAPIQDFWQVSRTRQDPSIPNLPLETPDAAPASFVPVGRSALVVGGIIVAAWAGPQFSALKLSAATESGPVVEQVQPPKVADQQVARNAAWRVKWDAQRRPAVAAIIPAAVASSAVPAGRQQAHIGASWQRSSLSALKVSTATEGGDWVLPVDTVDNPPPQARGWLWAVLARHQPARFGSYSSGVYTQPVSEPPRLRRQDIAGLWPRGWTIPPRAAKFPIQPEAAAADNPPPRSVVPGVEEWRQTWKAQRAPLMAWPTAATAVDDPPFRLQTIPAAVKAWAPPVLTAIKVSTATEDGATPPVAGDPPPVKRLEMPSAIAAWQPPAFGSYSSGVYTYVAPPDAPPPRVVQPTTIREQWQARATWQVPQRLPAVTESGPYVPPVPDTVFGGVWNYPRPITGLPPIHGKTWPQPGSNKEWLAQVAREVAGPARTLPQRAQEAVAEVAAGYVGPWDQARAEADLRAALLAHSIKYQAVYFDLLTRIYEQTLADALARQAVAQIEQAQIEQAAVAAELARQADEDDVITLLLLAA